MTKRIAIIQGHPDAAGHHLLNAMADAYAEAAASAGHEVRRVEVAALDFPLLRTQADFETGEVPSALVQARDDMRWASETSCSTTMTDSPPRAPAPSDSYNTITTTGANPSETSSQMSRRGLAISARPIAVICCWPPESVSGNARRLSRKTGNNS